MQSIYALLSSVGSTQFKLPEAVKTLGLVERREIKFPSDSKHESSAQTAWSRGCICLLPFL